MTRRSRKDTNDVPGKSHFADMPPSNRNFKADSRAASATTSEKSANEYERSKDIYYDDGNIVLVAQNTAYCVHNGHMARHSEVFRDVFAVAAQHVDGEAFDGCPVVHMSDNNWELQSLLETLYFIKYISPDMDPIVLASVLRLSTKYILDIPRKHTLDALGHWYPDTLQRWDGSDYGRPDPSPIIKVARETKANILLPAAFYKLCDSQPSVVMALLESTIDLDGFRVYWLGREALAPIFPEFLQQEWTEFPISPCGHLSCEKGWKTFSQDQQREALWDYNSSMSDPLFQLTEYSEAVDEHADICSKAKKIARRRCNERRAILWDHLPGIFGFVSWEKLREES